MGCARLYSPDLGFPLTHLVSPNTVPLYCSSREAISPWGWTCPDLRFPPCKPDSWGHQFVPRTLYFCNFLPILEPHSQKCHGGYCLPLWQQKQRLCRCLGWTEHVLHVCHVTDASLQHCWLQIHMQFRVGWWLLGADSKERWGHSTPAFSGELPILWEQLLGWVGGAAGCGA